MAPRELIELARLHGVVARYRAIDGGIREAPQAALLAVLRSLGVGLAESGDAAEALQERRRELEDAVTPPAVVTWLPGPARVPLKPPRGAKGSLQLLISLEQGGVLRAEVKVPDLPVLGRWTVWTLDSKLPDGVHRATLSTGRREHSFLWIAAPRLAHPTPERIAGIFAPLYALPSDRRPDCADLRDLEDLGSTVSADGMRLIATLPLDAAFLEPPVEPSPYAPVSRLFWNEAYLDLERLPEFAGCEEARRTLRTREAPRDGIVDWPSVARDRRRAVGLLAEEHHRQSPGSPELSSFSDSQPLLAQYATFRALAERHGRNWRDWPDPLPDPDPRIRRYHLYAQWRMHQQMETLNGRLAARDTGLYLDLPLGAHSDGFDNWCRPHCFLEGCSAGAPPDPFFTGGQDWGFSPPHPAGGRKDGHAYFRDSLRHHMRHCRVLRLDHVMGLYRVFCVPHGMPATDGVYLRQPTEELFAVLCLESRRNRCTVVGEDLGTVPDAVRQAMTNHGLLSMRILQFELDPKAPGRSLTPPSGTLAALNTHDMSPFAGFWTGTDVDDRVGLGRLDGPEAERERRCRSVATTALRRALELPTDAGPERVLRALLLYLADSEADILIVNIEDLWLETLPQNVPGTTSERPNWRRRMRRSMAEITADSGSHGLLREIVRRRRGESHGEQEAPPEK